MPRFNIGLPCIILYLDCDLVQLQIVRLGLFGFDFQNLRGKRSCSQAGLPGMWLCEGRAKEVGGQQLRNVAELSEIKLKSWYMNVYQVVSDIYCI